MPETSTVRDRRAPGPDLAALPNELSFMQVLWALVHRLDKTSKRMGRHLGVTGPQRLALRIVGLFPGVSAGAVASILHVHPSTLTGVLQRLAAQELIVRDHDPRDRRRAVLRLTALGRRVNTASSGTVEAAVARTLDGTSRHDVAAAIGLLERLADQLDRQGEPSPPPSPAPAPLDRRRSLRTGASAARKAATK